MRYWVAALGGAVVTCVQLAVLHQIAPWGGHKWKALRWWVAVAALDAGIGALAVLFASHAGGGGAGAVAGWVIIGVLVPLGLRSPVWRKRTVRRLEIEPGLTVVYDVVRGWMCYGLDIRMRGIERDRRHGICTRITANEWGASALLAAAEDCINEMRTMTPDQRTAAKADFYLQFTHDSDQPRVEGLIDVLRRHRLSNVLDRAMGGPPDPNETHLATAAETRAMDYVGTL
jgi:hypothetical protein